MRKFSPLLLLCFLLTAGPAFAQKVANFAPGVDSRIENAREFIRSQQRLETGYHYGPEAPATGIGLSGPSNTPTTPASGKTSSLGTEAIGTASNAYSIISPRSSQIATDEDLGLITFVHRQNIDFYGGGVVENGIYRVDYSTDRGATWNIDIGPLNPTPYPHAGRARYPQIAVSKLNPGDGVDDLRFGFVGPMTDGTGWGNYNWGDFSNLTQIGANPSTTQPADVNFGFLSNAGNTEDVIIPGALCEGLPGEFWFTDRQYDPAAEEYLDTLRIYKGTFNSGTGEVEWGLHHSIDLNDYCEPDPTTGYPRASGLGDVINFSPDGQTGWVAIAADVIEDQPTMGFDNNFDILAFYTTDGGQTWSDQTGDAKKIKLVEFSSIVDSISTLFENGDTSTGIPTMNTIDLVVDQNGNPHIFGQAINSSAIDHPDSLDFVSPGAFKVMVDITSTDGGQTWCSKHIGYSNTWRGTVSGTDLTFGNYPQASRNHDGSQVFFSWIDDIDSQDPQVMQPNLWGRALRVSDEAFTPIENFSEGDPVFQDNVIYPQAAQEHITNSGGAYDNMVPVVFLEIPNNDLLPVNFYFASEVGYNDADFAAQPNDLAVTAINSPGQTICGSATEDVEVEYSNAGTNPVDTFELTLMVDGPIDTMITRQVIPGTPLAPGSNGTETFTGIDMSLNGTYSITVMSSFLDDYVCSNNILTSVTINAGGSVGEIFTQDSIQGCGSVLLDAGLAGVPTEWEINGTQVGTNQTLLLDNTNFTSGDAVDVTVTPNGCPPVSDQVIVILNDNPTITVPVTSSVCAGDPPLTLEADDTNTPGYSYLWDIQEGSGNNQTTNDFTFNGAGYWVIDVTVTDDATGCDTTSQITVARWDVDADLSNLDTAFCDQNSISAANSTTFPGTQYEWSVNGGPFNQPSTSPNTALLKGTNTYEVRVSDPEGCGTDTDTYTISNYDSAFFELDTCGLSNAGTIQEQCALTLRIDSVPRTPAIGDTLTPITVLEWFVFPENIVADIEYDQVNGVESSSQGGIFVNNSDSIRVTFSGQSSQAFVILRYESGACQEQRDISFSVIGDNGEPCEICDVTIGIDEEESNLVNYNVYPNPSNNIFNVDFQLEERDDVTLRVIDINGRVVHTEELKAVEQYNGSIDLSDHANGMYLLVVSTSGGVEHSKLIKQ